MAEVLIPFRTLKGHTNAITAVETPVDDASRLISASRDKSLMAWSLQPDPARVSTWSGAKYGRAHRRYTGHSHFVSDVALSSDGQFALTSSWDRDLRLWDLANSATTKRFVGHTNDALSVAFSPDNRQIVSGSRDKSLRVWNTIGDCRYVVPEAHSDWVSSVRFSPVEPVLVTGSWDRTVRMWDVTQSGVIPLVVMAGHRGYVNAVAVSPDGSLCASGGRDGVAILWELGEGKALYEMTAGSIIHALCFCPAKYWLCAATEKSVMIWDLENKSLIQELLPGVHEAVASPSEPPHGVVEKEDGSKSEPTHYLPPPPIKKNPRLYCTSMSWSGDGSTLFTGYTDGFIRVWSTRLGWY
ncbi:hypothetical protein Cgig2_022341 [Carnegiea gigantea]|uniref:Guanine nucleotide-binding protein subunit beta-like protein n=1 Tax=Carnegiea gigantea TaxID=171969 RepID=A0A9Q1KGK5_9CARY|nr:hypothetical protein Cgig2_022341 [Carnegiea gigantea]